MSLEEKLKLLQSRKLESEEPKGHILVVDDEKDVAVAIQNLCPEYKVSSVYSANDAIEELRKRTYDAMVLDMLMKPMSGKEVIPIVQQLHPEMPVIVHTGYPGVFNETEIMEALKGFSFYSYVVKGNNQKLKEDIEKACDFQKKYKIEIHNILVETFQKDSVCPYTIIFDAINYNALANEELPKTKEKITKMLNQGVMAFCRISPLINHMIKDGDKRLCKFLDTRDKEDEIGLYNVIRFGICSYPCNYYVTLNPFKKN